MLFTMSVLHRLNFVRETFNKTNVIPNLEQSVVDKWSDPREE
jgi:hypothetical protein